MSEYIEALEQWLRKHANPEQAVPMQAYMRNQFPFLGLKSPERVELVKSFWKEHGVPKGEELLTAAVELWSLPEREFHYTALNLLDKRKKTAEISDIKVLGKLIVEHSWWDTVDILAAHSIGSLLRKYPELVSDYTERWIQSDNMWLRRTALLYQLRYKESTDTERLFRYMESCKHEEEFFIRKAIGWALREYAKSDEEAVVRYVQGAGLSPLSVKEALKHIKA
ncbi:DNA alkylation repair protein [Paenibacillus gorillae]|uniref:DNA alkylation repair protein n=1 Tax=Paenibacillus gorillae TaxID=1243662 RepID=UPI0005AAD201|nr:DNA alkylation repair protein [Paenibacillus gorillae]